ncbi:NepR family anti-sigma factor [uncultured Tateyamaria sp.]|uniref:NepR family anti-sigma factor n=1 Tax=Tateyamaria sp. 1078 TaxID=3417464 RepID=UPI00262B15E3|nr:NepR family anti-sigma factor [uncultured Tateyamaria sp.]
MGPKDNSSRMDAEIDKNLKRAFDDVAGQELPSRFTDLLDQLRAQEAEAPDTETKDE